MFLSARGKVLAGGAARKAVTVAAPLLGGRSSSIAATPATHLQPDRALGVDRLPSGVLHHAAPRATPSTGRWQSTVTHAASQAIVDVEATVIDDRIPVTVITGFLGSGKTTLLNHILSQDHGRRIAVIENEFGEIDIDSSLITKKEVVEGTNDTITTLSNGCLCCTVRDDLIQALNKLWRRRKDFDHIIIETTGMASPGPIISSFYVDPDLPKRVKLDGVVTVVDAKHVVRHLDEEKPEDVVNEAVEQIAYADRIILNKTDLVQEPSMRQLESRLREINKLAMVQRAQRSVVAVDYVLGVGGFDLRNVEKELDVTLGLNKAAHSHDHSHDHGHDHDHEHSCGNPTCSNPDHHHHHHDHADAHAHDHDHAHDHSHDHGHSHAEAQHSHDGHEGHSHEHGHSHEGDCHDPKCTNPDHQHSHEGMSVAAVKHDDKITSVSLVFEGDMDIDKINYSLGFLLESRADDIYRMKGILAIKDSEFRFVYQGVHMLFEGVPDRKWLPHEKRISKMVFIGRYLHKEDFEEAFRNCLAEPPAVAAAAPTPAGAAV